MRKWIPLTAVLAVLALAALAAVNLDGYLARNKQWLSARVEHALGRQVAFDEIGVALAGGFGVRISGVRIADDPAFSSGEVLRAESALIRVRLLPALFGRYEVSRVALESPVVTVRRTAGGLNVGRPAARAGASTDAAGRVGAGGAAALAIAFVDIDGGELRYIDTTTDPPTELVLANVSFKASDVRAGEPLSFELAAAALGANERNVHARGSVGPLLGTDIAGMPLAVDVHTESLSVEDLARVPEIAAALPAALEVDGPLAIALTANGTWAEARYRATVDASSAMVRYGAVFEKPAGVSLTAKFIGTRSTESIAIESGRVSTDHASFNVSGAAMTSPQARYDLAIDGGPVAFGSVAPLVPWLANLEVDGAFDVDLYFQGATAAAPASLGGSVALERFSVRDARGALIEDFSANAKLAGNKGTVQPVKFLLLGAPATLSAELDTAAKPTLTFSLASETVPLGARITPASGESPPDVLRDVRVDGALRLAAAALKLRGNAASSSGTLGGVPYEDFAADMRLDNGRAVLAPISARAFGGTVRGEGVYDLRAAKEPSFNFETNVAGVRLSELAAALGAEHPDRFDGAAYAKLTVAGAGADRDAVVVSLVGGGDVTVRGGALRQLNLVSGMLANLSGLPGLSTMLSADVLARHPKLLATEDTLFDALEARVTIAEGRVTSDKVTMRAPDFVAMGSGFLGFDGTVDLHASVELSAALSADLVAAAGDLQGVANDSGRVTVPLQIDGTSPNLRARPDLDRIAHALQKTAVQEFVDGILERERQRIQHSAAPQPPSPDTAGEHASDPGAAGASIEDTGR